LLFAPPAGRHREDGVSLWNSSGNSEFGGTARGAPNPAKIAILLTQRQLRCNKDNGLKRFE
jgi:hypothetical protein